jgi:hypothetical protein
LQPLRVIFKEGRLESPGDGDLDRVKVNAVVGDREEWVRVVKKWCKQREVMGDRVPPRHRFDLAHNDFFG